MLINTRLRKWANDNNVLHDNQFGFVKGKITVDCSFVLTSIIDKIVKHEKRKLYCSFVDFKKCFDYVYRNGIWFKLIEQGVLSKIVKALQSMYSTVKSCVRVNGTLSEFFDNYIGVKQREPLSPLLFIFIVNDMSSYLQTDSLDYLSIDELQIYMIQILLNKLQTYCNEWGITVNTDKIICMVFKKCNRVEQFDMFYNNNRLAVVQKFTYLGVTLSYNGLFYQAQKALANQSLKSLFALNSIFDTVALETIDKIKLLDSLVAPILNDSSEVWFFHDVNDVENIHLKLLKQKLLILLYMVNLPGFLYQLSEKFEYLDTGTKLIETLVH